MSLETFGDERRLALAKSGVIISHGCVCHYLGYSSCLSDKEAVVMSGDVWLALVHDDGNIFLIKKQFCSSG
jgi:hypothetical protein